MRFGIHLRLPNPRFTMQSIAAPSLIVTLFCGCLSTTGCGSRETPPVVPLVHRRDFKLIGVVRQVDPKSGTVTIRHEEIPGFMAAMTMPFTVKDRKSLEEIRPDDEVEGNLKVEYDGKEVKDYELSKLEVTRPALGPGLSLSLSKDGPALSTTPKILEPGELVPDFTMTTQEGKTLRLSDLRGKVVALTFIFTRCPLPDFCPRMDRKFAEVADRVSAVSRRAEKIRLISLSFDPEHDTPEILARHAATHGAKPPLWLFAVASHPELSKVAPRLGLFYGPQGSEIMHNLVIAVIDAEGKLVRLETGNSARGWDTTDLLKTLYARIPASNG